MILLYNYIWLAITIPVSIEKVIVKDRITCTSMNITFNNGVMLLYYNVATEPKSTIID